MTWISAIVLAALAGLAHPQSLGPSRDNHPKLTIQKCTLRGGCVPHHVAVVADSLAHPIYQRDNPDFNCGDWGQAANATACPDRETCHDNCVMDGITDYGDRGIFTSGDALTLKQLRSDGTVVTPRVYLLAEGEETYEVLKLVDQEFTFDVDVSRLPCGMNGAVYLSEMAEDGGRSRLNPGGASYGTGYCDAQCFTTPFINGVGNIEGRGACCNELDIWEANSRANGMAAHPCSEEGLYECDRGECEFEGVCDKWGCSFKPNKAGVSMDFGRGPGFKIDTTRPFTVVTDFTTDSDGAFQSMGRRYNQDGRQVPGPRIKVDGLDAADEINQEYCDALPDRARRFSETGGMKAMGEAMSRGMVLAMSIWWDHGENMTWLDSPPCREGEGAPSNIVKVEPDPAIVISNIRWGDIGSTVTDRGYRVEQRE